MFVVSIFSFTPNGGVSKMAKCRLPSIFVASSIVRSDPKANPRQRFDTHSYLLLLFPLIHVRLHTLWQID